MHRLTGGSLISSADLCIVDLMLNDYDLNIVKGDITFATDINN